MNLDSYVEELENRAEERINKEGIIPDEVWMCPACKKYTFVIEDAKDICYLCSYEETVVECDSCSQLNFEDSLEAIDYGNMKGLENWINLCADCVERSNNEDPYQDYY